MSRFAFVLACSLLQAHLSLQASDMDKAKEDVEHCMSETKVSSDALKKAYKDDDFGSNEPLKCFQKCLMIKENKINKEGVANLEPVKNYHKKSLEIINKCNEIKSNNTCEYAYQLHKCMGELKKILA
ncbi:hypothetical protein RN001_014187 [Aquatica leii]|uniref:Uncharacterized protein n=1 Tax=Aquatica leii TaxID=1421715 RepID=A0AAN7P1R6_9COLE|nr:hypothetical protein RN001_014187 [Aquatica leii]